MMVCCVFFFFTNFKISIQLVIFYYFIFDKLKTSLHFFFYSYHNTINMAQEPCNAIHDYRNNINIYEN